MGIFSQRDPFIMNEPIPESTPVQPASLPAYKDRSIGLIIFGVFTILMGCLMGLALLMMVAGMAMNARNPNVPPTPAASLVPVVTIYATLAVALVWLGTGSVMARRWARALLLIFSWAWLVMGIFMTIFMAFFMPKMFANLPANATNGQPAMPPEAMAG